VLQTCHIGVVEEEKRKIKVIQKSFLKKTSRKSMFFGRLFHIGMVGV